MTRMKKGKLGERKMGFGSGLRYGSRGRLSDWAGRGNAKGAETPRAAEETVGCWRGCEDRGWMLVAGVGVF